MPSEALRRDRLTWTTYAVLAWFAFLQAAPGSVVPHLRDELDLGYAVAGVHVVAFAAGSVIAGFASTRVEQALGRRRVLWSASAVLAAGTVALTLGQQATLTVGALVVMGLGGGLVMATVQATLADHHGPRRSVALTEANVAAGVSYLVLIGVLTLGAALGVGWRPALLLSLLVPALAWWLGRGDPVPDAPPAPSTAPGRLPPAFWLAAAVLMCTTAAEWCTTAWSATFVQDAVGVSADTAVALTAGYFGGVVAGRVVSSRLTARYAPTRLLAVALGTAAVGFVVTWPAQSTVQAEVGLVLLGVGLGNLFPLGLALTVGLVPDRAGLASGRAVAMTSLAVVVAPLTVGALADATSIRTAFVVVPVVLALASAGLAWLHRTALSPAARTRTALPR